MLFEMMIFIMFGNHMFFLIMIFFHIIYLSSQNRGLVTHGSLIEVIFQNKAPFFNEKPMNIGVWVLKFGHV